MSKTQLVMPIVQDQPAQAKRGRKPRPTLPEGASAAMAAFAALTQQLKGNGMPTPTPTPVVAPTAKVSIPRGPIPATSPYTFTLGQQVCLINLKHSGERKFRSHYEYVRRAGKYDVVRSALDGKEHFVWLNKLHPMNVAAQVKAKYEAEKA